MMKRCGCNNNTKNIIMIVFNSLLLWIIVVIIMFCGVVYGKKNVRIVSPLRSFTIWDDDIIHNNNNVIKTRREFFLEHFRIGLQAEVDAMKKTMMQSSTSTMVDPNDPNWSIRIEKEYRNIDSKNDKLIERAYDNAIQQFQHEEKMKKKQHKHKHNNNNYKSLYQFVGVINHHNKKDEPITWYTRRKRNLTKDWTIRLIHVDRNMILYDLFRNSKLDIYGTYNNHGIDNNNEPLNDPSSTTTGSGSSTITAATINNNYQPTITSQYHVRSKSWKNLWNLSMKNMMTDSSGMFWRERRLPSGLYTDGINLYESSYRYRDGRNGMHRISSISFNNYINQIQQKGSIKAQHHKNIKDRILHRLQHDTPDIVLEE